MSDKARHTPGAIRAGREISKRFRSALPNLPESNADTLAAIIDAETGAPEMLETIRHVLPVFEALASERKQRQPDSRDFHEELDAMRAAVRKASSL